MVRFFYSPVYNNDYTHYLVLLAESIHVMCVTIFINLLYLFYYHRIHWFKQIDCEELKTFRAQKWVYSTQPASQSHFSDPVPMTVIQQEMVGKW